MANVILLDNSLSYFNTIGIVCIMCSHQLTHVKKTNITHITVHQSKSWHQIRDVHLLDSGYTIEDLRYLLQDRGCNPKDALLGPGSFELHGAFLRLDLFRIAPIFHLTGMHKPNVSM